MPIRLRPTRREDLDFVLAAERGEENRAFVGQWTREQHAATLEDHDMAHLIVERTADKRQVGYIILAGLRNVNQSIEFRRIVVTEKGQGYGRAALRLVKQLAFEHWGRTGCGWT